jgi:hypothetical protein
MAKERTSVGMQTQIKQMSEQGHSIRTIARVLKLSRRTVRKYLEPGPMAAERTGGWEDQIDWEHVREEVNGRGTTIKQIGREVAPQIEYVKFWRAYWEYGSCVASPSEGVIAWGQIFTIDILFSILLTVE